jgi:putative membrane protein
VKFVIGIVANALALALAAWLLAGIRLTSASRTDQVITLVLVALIFGVINAVVRPVVKLLSLPFIILTLGLLIFVINALMLLLTSWISGQVGLGFHVDGFWTAIFGGIIVMVATWVIELVLPDGR